MKPGQTLLSVPLFLIASSLLLHAQLSGDYVVGEGGDFATLSAAVEKLNSVGVEGPTTFRILKGRYEEQVALVRVSGAGPRNPIIIESDDEDPRSVTLFYQHLGSSANKNEHVIRVDSTDNVTVRNLTLENPGEIYGTGLNVFKSRDVTLSNCIVAVTPEPRFSQPLNSCVFLFDASDMTVRGSSLSGGFGGVYASGLSDTTQSEGIVIEDCQMSNGAVGVGGVGISLQRMSRAVIRRNSIEMRDGVGIGLQTCDGPHRVEANRITMRPERFGSGINVFTAPTPRERSLFANNVIAVVDGDTLTSAVGITFSNVTKTDILYNTVHLSNGNTDRFQSTGNLAASFATFGNDSLRIYNNIFTNLRGREAITYPIGNNFWEADNNNIYTDGDLLGTFQGGRIPTLDSLRRATGQEQNGESVLPCYSASDDLRTHSATLDGAARPLPEVSRDIDGNPRDPVTPDIGAYEYDYEQSGLSGTYRVGPGGEYETLHEAIEDLHTRCVLGPVDFALIDGEHEGGGTINRIPGTSEESRITIRSESRNPERSTISLRATWFGQHLLRLRNTEYLTVEELRFLPLDTTFTSVTIQLVGHPLGVTIRRNIFENDESGMAPPRVTHIFSDEGDLPERSVIEENLFNGGFTGIRLYNCFGFGCDTLPSIVGTEILRNRFRVADTTRGFSTAISLAHHESPLIDGNDIETIGVGITLTESGGFVRVTNNRLDVRGASLSNSSASALSFSFPEKAEPFTLVANNMIQVHDPVYDSGTTTTLIGVNVGQARNTFLLYNTIVIRDSASTSLPVSIPFGADSIVMMNNILANYGGGPTFQTRFIERFFKDFGFDYNLLYTTGDTLAIWNDTGRVDLPSIRAVLGTDEHSVVGEPAFLSDDDLHISERSPAVNAGFPFETLIVEDVDYAALIARDFDDEVRDRDVTEIGADELDVLSVEPGPGDDGSLQLHAGTTRDSELLISYGTTRAGSVRLALIDLFGREVALLIDEERVESGKKTVRVEGTTLPSGLYILLLESNDRRKSLPVIVRE